MSVIAISVTTPQPPETFEFEWMSGREAVSSEYSFDIALKSDDVDLEASDFLGKPVTAALSTTEGERYFSGLVSRFSMSHYARGVAHYELTIRPWTWFLSKRHDCRIFQEKSVLEILEEVLSAHPQAAIDVRTGASYPEREYCVQFGESDLDFAKRLMEEEGIFYFFEYADGASTMVLVDDVLSLSSVPGFETVRYNADTARRIEQDDWIRDWKSSSSVVSGAVAHTNYDFKNPSSDLMAEQANPLGFDGDDAQVYSYPETHLDVGRGEDLATIRQEEIQTEHRAVTARGMVRGLYAGAVFSFADYPRAADNGDYFVTSVIYDTEGDGDFVVLHLQPSTLPYRPPRRTQRTVMKGPHTATVVGPDGEEIYTDEWGRVKVHFHWDRLGPSGEFTSCFVRVASVWAGANWGFQQVPRIDEEVIVDFIDGDPDRPLITGRVFNANQMPPFALPDNKTQSGIKTNSSPGGGGENMLRFEDKAGAEEIYMQAQKDLNELVKDSEVRDVMKNWTETVHENATQTVKGVRSETVNGTKDTTVDGDREVTLNSNDTETVAVNRTLTIGGDETKSVTGNSDETISGNHTQSVSGTQTITATSPRIVNAMATETVNVLAAQAINVGGGRSVTVVGGETHNITGPDNWGISAGHTMTVGGAQTFTVTGKQTFTVNNDQAFTVTGNKTVSVNGDSGLTVNGKVSVTSSENEIVINAANKITLVCGDASFSLEKNGNITFNGKEYGLKTSGKATIDAGGDLIGKGQNVKLN